MLYESQESIHKPDTCQHQAIALFSGGLDSILCVKWMQSRGYRVQPVFFRAPYFPTSKAIHSAELNGLDLKVIDIRKRHLEMLLSPSRGYGKNFNPCIDCHALMFEIAGDMLQELQADYIISGEVMGQRPMSQTKNSLMAVSKLSKYRDLIVRPLSQIHLPDTLPIREGWVNKEDMLGLMGRSRKPQLALARELGIEHFPNPGGGCLLTNPSYSLRIKELVEHDQLSDEDIELLRYGRHFRISPSFKLILGRSEAENRDLQDNFGSSTFIWCRDHLGPLGIIKGDPNDITSLQIAADILLGYVNKAPDAQTIVYGAKDSPQGLVIAHKMPRDISNQYMISHDKEDQC